MSGALEIVETGGWPFDLAATLGSGQVFHWHAVGGGHVGAVGEVPVFVKQAGSDAVACTAGTGGLMRRYLGLHADMAALTASFPQDDAALARAMAWCPGLRIVRQPVWECLATFITSSLKQVPHIRAISLRLRERFGRRLELPGLPAAHAYPSAEALADAGEAALRECGLGYRAAFLHRTAVEVAEGRFDIEAVAAMNDDAALAALCTLPGVGEKIASCALLFGYGRSGAFPIDVWIERVLRRLYFPRARKMTAQRLKVFASRHFGPHRGWAQQYLFHWARLTDCGARE